MGKKVTIELTSDQKDKIRNETGKELHELTFEPLEDRDAPKGRPFGQTPR